MPEGRVSITLSCDGTATMRYLPPGDIGRLLCGKTPENALQIVPVIHAVCGVAQSHAAVTALEQALGIRIAVRTKAARTALTAMEALREHVLRIALEWPAFCGDEPRPAEVADVMSMGNALKGALFGPSAPFAIGTETSPDIADAERVIAHAEALLVSQIFGEPLEVWRSRRGIGNLSEWANASKTIAARLFASIIQEGWFAVGSAPVLPLSPPSAETIRDLLVPVGEDATIAAASTPDGTPEATVFTRNRHAPFIKNIGGEGLGTRLLAQLVELAATPKHLRALLVKMKPKQGKMDAQLFSRAETRGNGLGIASVEAARGLLIHAVELRNGLIQAYRILPPTRWNFDANGVAMRCLSRLEAADSVDRLRQAHLIVSAIDPCVHHEVALAR
jgi:uptake hydrogenase large subunit